MCMSACCREQVTQATPLPEGVALRVMKAADLPHIRALHRNLLPISYPAAFFLQLLINPRQLCLVATAGGAIVGFASAAMGPSQPGFDEGYIGESSTSTLADRECSEVPRSHITVVLLTLGVLPSYQRRGIGRSMVYGVVQRLVAATTRRPDSDPTSSDHISDLDSKIAVLVQVQVAQSNAAAKRFYAHLGMIGQEGCDDVRLGLGPASQTSIMEGVLFV